MKLKTTNQPALFRWGKAALLASCALLLPLLKASADDVTGGGMEGSWIPPQFSNLAVFTLGAGSGDTDTLIGNSKIVGDVGVAGSGKISLSDYASIQGRLSYKTNGTLTRNGTHTTITGPIYKNSQTDSYLNQGVSIANSVSDYANGLQASSGYPTTINQNTSLTLTASGRAVLKLTDFKLSNATLTLDGTAQSSFVINVANNFSLTSANVRLGTHGITWDHILFNVRNTGSATLTGTSSFTGVLLAAKRTVSLNNTSMVNGIVIANKLAMADSSMIKRPPHVSP